MESFGRSELLSRSKNLRDPYETVTVNPQPENALDPQFLKNTKFLSLRFGAF
jgi:hypothetical protein